MPPCSLATPTPILPFAEGSFPPPTAWSPSLFYSRALESKVSGPAPNVTAAASHGEDRWVPPHLQKGCVQPGSADGIWMLARRRSTHSAHNVIIREINRPVTICKQGFKGTTMGTCISEQPQEPISTTQTPSPIGGR